MWVGSGKSASGSRAWLLEARVQAERQAATAEATMIKLYDFVGTVGRASNHSRVFAVMLSTASSEKCLPLRAKLKESLTHTRQPQQRLWIAGYRRACYRQAAVIAVSSVPGKWAEKRYARK